MPSNTLDVCPACASAAPAGAKFCPQCGEPLDGREPTTRHVFGVLAPGPAFVLACLLLVGAVLTLLAGSSVAAIVLAALSAAAFVFFYLAAKRDRESPVVRQAIRSGHRVRGWAAFARESVEAWARATRAVVRLSRESRSLRRERARTRSELGEAAYRDDTPGVEALRLRMQQIDDDLAAHVRAKATALANARRHVEEERVAVHPTQRFSADELTSHANDEG